MDITSIEVKESKINRNYSELYRQLECNYISPRTRSGADNERKSFYEIVKWIQIFLKGKDSSHNQAEAFQAAMKFLIISGQCVGLLPFVGVLEKDVTRVRYQRRSIRYVCSCMMCIAQTVALLLSLFRLLRDSISVSKLGYFSFYSSTCLTSIVFLRLASKWEHLMRQISTADLNEYIDPYVKFKCNLATLIFITAGLAEISAVFDCYSPDQDLYRIYIEQSFPWLFDTGLTYSAILGIILPLLSLTSTVIWSYSHLFTICMSFFLSSILEEINKKIKLGEGEHLPSSSWRKLREDYSRATQLVRSFDEVINNIVFASFASNLFFVCLRLYNVLAYGVKSNSKELSNGCPFYPSGIFQGSENMVYLSFSLAFVLMRSLAVSLIAAHVHSASLIPAPLLYNVPSPAYCTEVQRFIEQVHGDMVALSGLNFFYVTKELVLSVAGTIVTYELVLLQFNG